MPMTTPIGARGSSSGQLLATKLHVPPVKPGHVVRQRLIDHLDASADGGLVLLCAPAGSGKTDLLVDWCQRRDDPVAWLSLDRGDNDPVRFWRHLLAAVDARLPGTRRAATGCPPTGSAT